MTITKLIKLQTNLLNQAADAYYNTGQTIMTDQEYDLKLEELRKLEIKYGFQMANSPTKRVGYEVKSELNKVTHSSPMLSMDKTKDTNKLIQFAGNKECILSLKMDGLSIALTYENGKLMMAETRGDSLVGEDVTHNAKVFTNIPLSIPYYEHLEVRGECIITYLDFNSINDKLPDSEKYKNPRNLASGSVRQLDSKIAKNRHLQFVCWEVVSDVGKTYEERFDFARTLGFTIVPYIKYDRELLIEQIDALKNKANNYGYPIDGLIFSYNDIAYGKSLGVTDKFPRHSIAYKFYDDEYTTNIRDVTWTMGMTGTLCPTAIFDTVEIDGTDVSKASLHNVSIFENLNLHPGDCITVYKANKIIPQIADNLDKDSDTWEDNFPIPSTCPICGSQTEIQIENTSKVLWCTNPDCKGKLLGKLVHFCSRDRMDVRGLSEEILNKLIKMRWIERIIDLYSLNTHRAEWMCMDGFGEKSVKNILLAIENSRINVKLDKFIAGLGIPNIGRTASKTISKTFKGDSNKFKDALLNHHYDWTQLEDFGEIMSRSLKRYGVNHKQEFLELFELMSFEKYEEPVSAGESLNGKTFVVTGSVHLHKNRKEIEEKIKSYGGKITGSVSKNTNYLICNEKSSSSKYTSAVKNGVPIITEEDFIQMCG